VIDINDSYDLLNFWFPGQFRREDRFRIEETPIKPNAALLNTDEAAEYLSISAETLRRLCRRKAITFIQITPSEYRFSRKDLNEYVSSRRNRRKSALYELLKLLKPAIGYIAFTREGTRSEG
jgi:excisionase family DNA binding protein